MRSMFRGLTVALCASAFASPLFATSNTYTFSTNTTAAGVSSSIAATGAAMSFTGKSSDGGTAAIKATVTAWNANPTSSAGTAYTVAKAQLGIWDGGLGVVSGYDNYNGCGTGNCGMHQIDGTGNSAGSKSYDFVQITFDKAVTLSSVSRVAYGQVMGGKTVYDDDFSFGSSTSAAELKSLTKLAPTVAAGQLSNSAFNAMLDGYVNVAGGCTVRNYGSQVCFDTNSTMNGVSADQWHASTVWWISASLLNPDNVADAFKLYDFSVIYNDAPIRISAVPEPASWAMMIGGFGLVGGALRRRRAAERLATA